jgi:hypothetical protein
MSARKSYWKATIKFAHPAWDEVDGIVLDGIYASSKADAQEQARHRGKNDGHLVGKGRYTIVCEPDPDYTPYYDED